ncbi:MAG: hypothetical protein ACYTG6_06365 [Planctomycetota bacterium]
MESECTASWRPATRRARRGSRHAAASTAPSLGDRRPARQSEPVRLTADRAHALIAAWGEDEAVQVVLLRAVVMDGTEADRQLVTMR